MKRAGKAAGWAALLALLLVPAVAAMAAGETGATLVVGESSAEIDGRMVEFDGPVHVTAGSVWGPVRAISEGLDAVVGWDGTTRQATVARGGDVRMLFTVGSSTALINGGSVNLPGPVYIVNDRMQVPLDILGEAFGFRVERSTAPDAVRYAVPEAAPAAATRVELREAGELGPILTDARGMTLYLFTRDSGGMSNCYDMCERNWPPLLAEGELQAGMGVEGELGVTTRRDGSRQVTYDGMPLYYFIRDMKPGDTAGQGINDVWYVIQPASQEPEAEAREPEPPSGAESPGAEPPAEEARTIAMDIRNFAFADADLTINAGDTVVWTNRDSAAHTVTGDGLDSGTLVQGESYRFTFTEPGTYEYICAFHPSMTGRVTVR